jgi:hypothetical protein
MTVKLAPQVTLFFEESQTELAIELSLTIMLVMYTMYQSINESLTKTAYLKLFDYWLLFCLLIPIAVFLIEIFWLLNKKKETDASRSWASKVWLKIQNRKTFQILIPIITGIVTAVFDMFVIIINFDLQWNID